MSTARRWQTVPPRGSVVDDPVVHRLVAAPDPGVDPRAHKLAGRTYVVYSRTRVYFDRVAWEMLPPDGVLVMRVRPTGGRPWAIAMTLGELERSFGEVRESASWDRVLCYHFPSEPPAVQAFVVGSRRP